MHPKTRNPLQQIKLYLNEVNESCPEAKPAALRSQKLLYAHNLFYCLFSESLCVSLIFPSVHFGNWSNLVGLKRIKQMIERLKLCKTGCIVLFSSFPTSFPVLCA